MTIVADVGYGGRIRAFTPDPAALWPAACRNLALGQLQAAFDLAERDGKAARNPVRFVKQVKREASDHVTWSDDQVGVFIEAAAGDRLHACWLLSLLGLRWSDVSLIDGTIAAWLGHTIAIKPDRPPGRRGPKSWRSSAPHSARRRRPVESAL